MCPGTFATAPLALAALALAAVAASCTAQRWPAPMASAPTLGAGVETVAAGLDEVLVTRLADPVRVRPAQTLGAVALSWTDKRRRLSSGSSVHIGAGGRVEVTWPGETLLAQVFDGGSLRIGRRELGEPAFYLHRPVRARITLPPGTTVRLVDHADLSAAGDAVGPLWIERTYDDVVRVFNNGSAPLLIDVGGALVALAPSQSVDLPEVGDAALEARLARTTLPSAIVRPDGQSLRWSGPLVLAPEGGGVALSGGASAVDFSAFGSLWHLAPGSRVLLYDDPSGASQPAGR